MNNLFRTDGWVKSTQGPAVPGAQVFVCTQPANIASFPPSPLAPTYSDPGGLIPLAQPVITDGFGHYDFYTVAGLYTVVVANGGLIQQVYPDQSVGGIGTGGTGSTLTLENNGVANGSQTLLNLVAGTGITVTDDGLGDITLNSLGASFVTPNQGWFLGGQDWGPIVDNSGEGAGSANVVNVVQVQLLATYTISTLSCYVITGAGSGYMCCALYSANGSTKLIDAGTNAFDTHSNSQVLRSVSLATPVTLNPGVYWFAYGSTDGSGTLVAHTPQTWLPTLFSGSTARIGTAANVISSGKMPATLGTITALANTGADIGAVTAVMFQV